MSDEKDDGVLPELTEYARERMREIGVDDPERYVVRDPEESDEFGLAIEWTGTPDETHHLYVERGTVEGGVWTPDGGEPRNDYSMFFEQFESIERTGGTGWPVRDIFPSMPADRGAVQYPTVRTKDAWYGTQPRRVFLRGELRRLRRWWRAHWWPARIRDLEAELRRVETDMWDD